MREKFGRSFRSYRQATLEVKEAKTIYNKKQDEIAGQKMTLKQTSNMKIEGRLVKQVQMLKEFGGPFTSTQEIDIFLKREDIGEKVKANRMKTEVMVARDTSLSLPKNNPVFRIRTIKIQGKKTRQLNPEEFGDNLKILLNKKLEAADRSVSIKSFVQTIDAITMG